MKSKDLKDLKRIYQSNGMTIKSVRLSGRHHQLTVAVDDKELTFPCGCSPSDTNWMKQSMRQARRAFISLGVI